MLQGMTAMQFGCDPEFFFVRKTKKNKRGTVIGAEKVLPAEGIRVTKGSFAGSKVIIDGVQAELNPTAHVCRAYAGDAISRSFKAIKQELDKKKLTICWDPLVKVTKKEMKTLSEKSQVFGCSPSLNAYGEEKTMPDPHTYLFRCAGGHLHLGDPKLKTMSKANIDKTVKVLDIIVGNTCVLIDRDPGNIERRKVYGRAGEYRRPAHGLEYRVLSNFWLQHYSLMSMVMGLARLGVAMALDEHIAAQLLTAVTAADIRNAINNNDLDLAKKNWNAIKPIIIKESHPGYAEHSLTSENVDFFEFFANKGIKHWFKGNPMAHWTRRSFDGHASRGFERVLIEAVAPQMHATP